MDGKSGYLLSLFVSLFSINVVSESIWVIIAAIINIFQQTPKPIPTKAAVVSKFNRHLVIQSD